MSVMDSITLRDAIQNDASFVNALTRDVMTPYVNKTWDDEASREYYFKINAFKIASTQIISEHGEPVGRISLSESKNEITIDAIHLVLGVQGRGIGSALLKQVIGEAKSKNKIPALIVLKSNPAITLYKRLGFVIIRETTERFFMHLS